ncbi:LOW QUALITY PROTEIN: hypothetical protein U9M48_028055 [Paspalum notatum var. saurae]|uniref:Uncharacterized protein n=1 Tax=Paspalum notatum var. saurae TaxID=547442 RepID=A0AAQ3WZY7_PASNO
MLYKSHRLYRSIFRAGQKPWSINPTAPWSINPTVSANPFLEKVRSSASPLTWVISDSSRRDDPHNQMVRSRASPQTRPCRRDDRRAHPAGPGARFGVVERLGFQHPLRVLGPRSLIAGQLRRCVLRCRIGSQEHEPSQKIRYPLSWWGSREHSNSRPPSLSHREDVADLDLVAVARGLGVGARRGARLVAEAAWHGDVRTVRAHLRGADGLRVGAVDGAPASRPGSGLQRLADGYLGRVLLHGRRWVRHGVLPHDLARDELRDDAAARHGGLRGGDPLRAGGVAGLAQAHGADGLAAAVSMAVAALKPPPPPCGTWTPVTLSSADRMAAASRGAMGWPARSPVTANTWPYLMAACSDDCRPWSWSCCWCGSSSLLGCACAIANALPRSAGLLLMLFVLARSMVSTFYF